LLHHGPSRGAYSTVPVLLVGFGKGRKREGRKGKEKRGESTLQNKFMVTILLPS